MARPSKGGAQVNVRLPDDVIEALEEWREELRASGAIGTGGVSRSDLIRDVVIKAVEERRAAPKGKAKR